MPSSVVTAAAVAVITEANGCVASMTASMWLSRSQVRRPEAPPKPPIRISPTGSAGERTRPASDEITRT
jgi:hypothetical protein